MNVQELINKLRKFERTLEVILEDPIEGNYYSKIEVRTESYKEKKVVIIG